MSQEAAEQKPELGSRRRTKNVSRRVSSSDEEEAYHSATESAEPASGCPECVTGCPETEEAGREAGYGGNGAEKEGKEEEEGEGVEGDLTKLTVQGGNTSDQEVGGAAGEERVELTEEQFRELKERATAAKQKGNEHFKNGDYKSAIDCYTEALQLYPKSHDKEERSCDHERAVCFANRAAGHMKKDSHQDVIDDCSEALTLDPQYLKALLRRAAAREALEKYEEALEDYKKVLELDPSQVAARQAMVYLPDKVEQQREKLKAEMLGKLKELGNAILNPFGLSTDNFQFQQDPNTGGYSVNFKR